MASTTTKGSLLKRTNTLKKKTFELATLCGVDAVLIIFEADGPQLGGQSRPIEPQTWPESPHEVRRILKRYQDCTDLDRRERKRRKIEVLDYDRGGEAEIKNESEIPTVESLSAEDMKMLLSALDSKLLTVNDRIRELEAAAAAAEGIQCCAGTPDGICDLTAFECDWQALCDDESVSPLQLLMDGPDYDLSDDSLFLSQNWGCGVGPSFTHQSDDHHLLMYDPGPSCQGNNDIGQENHRNGGPW